MCQEVPYSGQSNPPTTESGYKEIYGSAAEQWIHERINDWMDLQDRVGYLNMMGGTTGVSDFVRGLIGLVWGYTRPEIEWSFSMHSYFEAGPKNCNVKSVAFKPAPEDIGFHKPMQFTKGFWASGYGEEIHGDSNVESRPVNGELTLEVRDWLGSRQVWCFSEGADQLKVSPVGTLYTEYTAREDQPVGQKVQWYSNEADGCTLESVSATYQVLLTQNDSIATAWRRADNLPIHKYGDQQQFVVLKEWEASQGGELEQVVKVFIHAVYTARVS